MNRSLGLEELTVIPITDNGAMLQEVAGLHLDAFAGYLNVQFGRGYAKAVIKWFVKRKDAVAIAALDDNQTVVGYALGAPSGYNKDLNSDLFWEAAVHIIMRPWLFCNPQLWFILIARAKIHMGFSSNVQPIVELPKPFMSLVGIGVALSQRRSGVGQ